MPDTYEIAWVGNKTREWSSKKGGQMIDFTIALEDREGTLKLTQKPATPAPEVGQELYGHIESEEVTPRDGEPFTAHKFVKDQKENGQPHRIDANKAARQAGWSREAQPGGSDFDARGARIERQAAWKAAATLTAAEIGAGKTTAAPEGRFKEWLRTLSEDLDAYEKARFGGAAEGEAAAPQEVSEDQAKGLLNDDSDIPF